MAFVAQKGLERAMRLSGQFDLSTIADGVQRRAMMQEHSGISAMRAAKSDVNAQAQGKHA
jgi:hypothetical protein